MRDMLGLAFDAAVFGIGSLAAGYTLWQVNTFVRKPGTIPPRAMRLWKWRIALGLCVSIIAICFGANDLLAHHGGFEWLLILEIGVGAGFGGVLFMTNNPESYAHAPRRAPDDNPQGDPSLRPQQPADHE